MVFPLKDTLTGERAPVATLALVAATFAAFALVQTPGLAEAAQLAVCLTFLWIFGSTLEDALGRAALVASYAAGAVAAVALSAAVDAGSASLLAGATGAVSAVLGGYLAMYPRARVLWAVLLPFVCTVVEVPVLAMLALWVVQAVAFAASGAVLAGQLAAALLGAAAVRALARPRRRAPAPYRIA